MLHRALREWLVPPGVAALAARWRTPRTQKFWCGEPLEPARREGAYFRAAGYRALTLTRQDDSRTVARLPAGRITLAADNAAADHLQLAVVAERWTPSDRLTVRTSAASVEHSGLASDRWLDIRLPGSPAHGLTLESSAPIFCTMPRGVSTGSTERGIRHVLVLILDGLTPFLELGAEDTGVAAPAAPHIENFFRDGFFAGNGWATGEWTLPTTASFFTGQYTSRHRMYHPTRLTRPPEDPLLAELLQARGFHTLALSTANRLTPAYGSHRGFDRFLYHWPYPGRTALDYDPARWCDEILGHLDTHRGDRTFSYVQFPDTHPAWNIPPLTRAFNLQRRGDSTGHDLDALRAHPHAAQQGKLLNAIRLHELDRLLSAVFLFIDREIRDSTLVVLTADHGTPWFPLRARRPADEPYLVDQRLHVVLRMRGPGVPRTRLEGLCSPTIDLLPTILARLGIEPPGPVDGTDLLAPGYRRNPVISESLYGGVYELAVRDGKRAYIEKFRLDDDRFTLGAAPHYARCFPAGATDYSQDLAEDCADLAQRAKEHRIAVGLTHNGS